MNCVSPCPPFGVNLIRRVDLDSDDEATLVGPAQRQAKYPDALAVQLEDDVADRRRLVRWLSPDDEPGPAVWWLVSHAEIQLEPGRPVRVGFQARVAAGGAQGRRVGRMRTTADAE